MTDAIYLACFCEADTRNPRTLIVRGSISAGFLIRREFPRLCRGGRQTLRIPGVFPRLLLWCCRSSLSNELHAVAVAFAFHRLRSGPFEGPATESLRLCRRILTGLCAMELESIAHKWCSRFAWRRLSVPGLAGECHHSTSTNRGFHWRFLPKEIQQRPDESPTVLERGSSDGAEDRSRGRHHLREHERLVARTKQHIVPDGTIVYQPT